VDPFDSNTTINRRLASKGVNNGRPTDFVNVDVLTSVI